LLIIQQILNFGVWVSSAFSSCSESSRPPILRDEIVKMGQAKQSANKCLNNHMKVFVVYFTTVSIYITIASMEERLMNDESERISKEAIVA
jgi:hypothetical protein